VGILARVNTGLRHSHCMHDRGLGFVGGWES